VLYFLVCTVIGCLVVEHLLDVTLEPPLRQRPAASVAKPALDSSSKEADPQQLQDARAEIFLAVALLRPCGVSWRNVWPRLWFPYACSAVDWREPGSVIFVGANDDSPSGRCDLIGGVSRCKAPASRLYVSGNPRSGLLNRVLFVASFWNTC
jgi:hypothetical protein